jgi:diadenylate cyclase
MKVALDFVVHMLRHFTMITFLDILDVVCLSAVLFVVYKFVKERRAGKLMAGIGILALIGLICALLNLRSMQYLLSHFFDFGIVVLIVIFQPEIRSALEKIGDNPIKGVKSIGETKTSSVEEMITIVSNAIFELAKTKTGAIIVFERNTKLGDYTPSGTVLNAYPSVFLIRNIFFNKAPLHDGAIIIRDAKIHSAGCMLPLTNKPDVASDLGTRHRAAIGISEVSDCLAVVVSEETGVVSITNEGHIYRNFTKSTIKEKLEEFLLQDKLNQKEKRGAKYRNHKRQK